MGQRYDLTAGVGTMMAAFISAHPTLLVRHFRSRPASILTDWPCSWLEWDDEPVHYDSALRASQHFAVIHLVDRLTETGETSDRFDLLIDAFRDHIDSYAHIIPGSIWSDAVIGRLQTVDIGDGTGAGDVPVRIGPIEVKPGRL